MKRRLFAALAIPFPILAQTRLSVDQIKPNQIVVSEELTRAADKVTLTLAFEPVNDFIQLFVNGLSVRPGRDFSRNGRTITLIASYAALDNTATFDAFYYR